MPIYQTPPVDAECRSCGSPFQYDAEHYARNCLTPPRSCKPCIVARKDRSIELRAVITNASENYIFAKADDGVTYYISPSGLDPKVGLLYPNDLVIITVDPGDTPVPGRKPRGTRVRRA